MINIRPISDLRNNFTEIESVVKKGEPVYLTKKRIWLNGCTKLRQYAALTDEVELRLDEADRAAELDPARYTEEEVFGRVRARINGR